MRIKLRPAAFVLCIAFLLSAALILAADSSDGISLTVSKGPSAGDVTLDWAGGLPDFEPFRSTDASTIEDPGNSLGSTSSQQWVDSPPAGGIFFYRVANQTCSSGIECSSGNCADSVCCTSACSGTCEACNLFGLGGTCYFIPAGTDPDDECFVYTTCDGDGSCTSLNGVPCGSGGECASGWCVDGFCCESACGALCEACDQPGNEGNCRPVPAGSDPYGECSGALVCDGSGGCAAPDGYPCTSSPECASGWCVDGFCCGDACSGPCEACDIAGSEGTCSYIPADSDPDDECPGALTCDGTGACSGQNGEACGSGTECISGWCVDGYCCNSSCPDLCESCGLPGSEGACSNVPAGTDPYDECAGVTVCDGTGGCALPNGAACSGSAECASAWCVDGFCCAGSCSGTCEACNIAGSEGTCSYIPADSDPDDECPGALTCDGAGSCSGQNGESCSSPSECISGWCVDGYCCNSSCPDLCESCGLPGSEGACSNVPAGTDPYDECAGVTVCDGTGACALPNGSSCSSSAECISGWCVDGYCCDSSCPNLCESCGLPGSEGACSNVPAGSDPYDECSGVTVCDGAGGCALPNGAACGSSAECISSWCVDSYCCDRSCSGTCEACDLTGREGSCDPIPSGSDPDDECPGSLACNGAGSCSGPIGSPCSNGTECMSGWCVDGYCCDSSCSGLCEACDLDVPGTCDQIPYYTDPDDECPGAALCDGAGSCLLPDGSACTSGAECLSGWCPADDGYCCESACSALCEACNLPGLEGTCDYIPAGTDPDSECGPTATCDGNGSCI
jgi:hypothetical protein